MIGEKGESHLINVQPLRTQEDIKDMINALRRGNKATQKRKDLAERDVLLFLTRINTGLRAGDPARLKVGDVRTDACYLQEQKTGKKQYIGIRREEINCNHEWFRLD